MSELTVFPCLVQGIEAAKSVEKAVKYFNYANNVDLIIIARGGGSSEDLSPFNDENLARTVAASEIPVISAVGHETDFTILDFVSSLRAPTPSAAAELALPDERKIYERINSAMALISASVSSKISLARSELKRDTELSYSQLDRLFKSNSLRSDRSYERLLSAYSECISGKRREFSSLCGRISELDPLKPLSRGYAVISKDGKVVSEISNIEINDKFTVKMKDGEIDCVANEKRANI